MLSRVDLKKDSGFILFKVIYYHKACSLLNAELVQQCSSILVRTVRTQIILDQNDDDDNNNKLDCWFSNIFTDTSGCIQERWLHFLIGMPITIKSSARVTSWRSNTDSACFLSSTIPSVSPSLAKATGLYL